MYNKGWDWSHRYQCHRLCHAAMAERCAAESRDAPPLGRCRTFWRTQHCECFSVEKPLHRQLKPWMPKGLYFCRVCERFTVRKRWHNGRCLFHLFFPLPSRLVMRSNVELMGEIGYHGLGKTRRRQNGGIRWTHRSRRGGFGYKMWAKGFRNEAMDRMEARLRHPSDRHNNKRYELRQLPPRMIDTKEVRDSHARHWQS